MDARWCEPVFYSRETDTEKGITKAKPKKSPEIIPTVELINLN